MEGNVAVLGSSDFVMPFSAMGLDTFETADTADQVTQQARAIIKGDYALVVIAENVAALADEVFGAYDSKVMPCVVVVPFTTESKGFATAALGRVLKMATGIDILQNN